MELLNSSGGVIVDQQATSPEDTFRIQLAGTLSGMWDSGTNAFKITGNEPPIATATVLGLVKVGANLTVDGAGLLSVNTSTMATKNYVDTAINDLINGAPNLLNTLEEIANALGDDPNFAATITQAIADLNARIDDVGTFTEFQTYMDANLIAIV